MPILLALPSRRATCASLAAQGQVGARGYLGTGPADLRVLARLRAVAGHAVNSTTGMAASGRRTADEGTNKPLEPVAAPGPMLFTRQRTDVAEAPPAWHLSRVRVAPSRVCTSPVRTNARESAKGAKLAGDRMRPRLEPGPRPPNAAEA